MRPAFNQRDKEYASSKPYAISYIPLCKRVRRQLNCTAGGLNYRIDWLCLPKTHPIRIGANFAIAGFHNPSFGESALIIEAAAPYAFESQLI